MNFTETHTLERDVEIILNTESLQTIILNFNIITLYIQFYLIIIMNNIIQNWKSSTLTGLRKFDNEIGI